MIDWTIRDEIIAEQMLELGFDDIDDYFRWVDNEREIAEEISYNASIGN